MNLIQQTIRFAAISLLFTATFARGDFFDAVGSIIFHKGANFAEILGNPENPSFSINKQMPTGYTEKFHANLEGWTLLMMVTASGSLNHVKFLVEKYGASKTIINKNGDTAADIARKTLGKHPIYAEILAYLTGEPKQAAPARIPAPAPTAGQINTIFNASSSK